jgi:membrane protease YdiL (CAAX protease family)
MAGKAAVGVAVAVVPSLAVLPLVLQETALAWAGRTPGAASLVLALALPGALLVGLIEESFFRVSVFGNLARRWPVSVAAAISAVFYGAVHFLTPDRGFVPASAAPSEGLCYLGRVLGGLASGPTLLAVGGLTVLGLVLCAVLWRTGSLALCVGMHAGWFAVTKVAILVTTLEPGAPASGSLGKRLLLLGSPWVWLAFVVSCVLAIVLFRSGLWQDAATRTGGA